MAGAAEASKQLALSVSSGIDRIANYSALVALARQAALALRFGRDVREGAVREELFGVRRLVDDPEGADVREAWAVTRSDLDRLATLCRRRQIRLGSVVVADSLADFIVAERLLPDVP